jgi:DNA-binding MarR family transcriptional regulator
MAGKSSAVKRGEALGAGRAPGKPAPVESAPAAVKPGPVRTHAGNEDAGLDRLIYERVRLGIMSALAMNEQLTFNELKALFDVSDGNLSAHARKLEEAGYVACTKSFEARRPKSVYRITPVGKRALLRYLEHIEAVIKATRHS